MHIHWFPGHMKKAYRTMQQELRVVDSVIYVLDARAPLASINPMFDELIASKPALYILNKADLVPQKEVLRWQQRFMKEGKHCLYIDSTVRGGTKNFITKLNDINIDRIERYKSKGIRKTIRAMVIGVPNSGKSTLINSLIGGRKKLVTANRPGVTRGKQWVSVSDYLEIMDTPGTLYPDFTNQEKAMLLAFIGSIRDDILDINELALAMIDFLKRNYQESLINRYNLGSDLIADSHRIKEEIAKRRGYIARGGTIDEERTARAIIADFRKQAFGKIILEKA